MLRKTEDAASHRGPLHFLRDAGLVGLALATLTSALPADEGIPGSSDAAVMDGAEENLGEGSSRVRRWSSTRSSKSVRRVVGSTSSDPSDTPAELLFYNADEVPARPVAAPGSDASHAAASSSPQHSPPSMAAHARNQISAERNRSYSRVEKTDAGFASRMNYVLSGGMITSSAESVGDWWEERSGRMLKGTAPSNAGRRQPAMQRIASAADSMMERSTLPENPDPEVDSYEAGPIAVSAPILQTSGFDDESSELAPKSRLKTDIRTIKPTLSYALKNIDKEQLPEDFDATLDAGEYSTRQSSPIVFQWAPTNFYHYPLYFEDPSLERYGHTYHPAVQPFASTGLFATQLIGLPYQMTLNPVHSKQYSLGYYRPGEYAPKKHYQIPFNEEATIIEVATMAGLFLIIP